MQDFITVAYGGSAIASPTHDDKKKNMSGLKDEAPL
jgi:hypothetical protein